MKKVGIVMGSDSDLPVLEKAVAVLKEYGVPYEMHVYSAHRTPLQAHEFSSKAIENGFGVIIAAAGKAAHLAGSIAANTVLPVIGIPVKASELDGLDALLSTVQMPSGIPVATVAINGAQNAALLAIQILAVEDNKEDCIALLKEKTADEQRIVVTRLKTKYPQGAERQLIYATTKRKIDSTKLPADVGCVVNNVDSIVAIYNAVYHRKPLMERIVTITGDAVRNPQNMRVHIGTNYKELIEEAGGFVEEPVKIISGGPMMGFGIFELDLPTTKTASALLCLTKDEVSEMEPSACINCGRCLEVCPGRVMPSKLATLAEKHKEEEFIAHDGMECCECGCCSYVCPAKRHLTQSIKSMRKIVLSKKKK